MLNTDNAITDQSVKCHWCQINIQYMLGFFVGKCELYLCELQKQIEKQGIGELFCHFS